MFVFVFVFVFVFEFVFVFVLVFVFVCNMVEGIGGGGVLPAINIMDIIMGPIQIKRSQFAGMCVCVGGWVCVCMCVRVCVCICVRCG